MYGIQHGAGHSSLVESDPVQEGLQPAHGTLHVRVQEGEGLPARLLHPPQARLDQPVPGGQADDTHIRPSLHVVV